MIAALTAGKMDRQIVIQQASAVQSDSGELSFDWAQATENTVWAQWLESSAVEVFKLQRVGSYIDGLFRVYDMSPRPAPESTRILFDGRLYDLTGVVEIGRGRGLELLVKAHGETP